MRHDQFLEIIDDLQKILNGKDNYMPSIIQSPGPIQIHYNNQSFYILRLNSWTVGDEYGYQTQMLRYELLYHEPFLSDSTITEFSKLINYCKKNIKSDGNYENLLEKIRKCCDIQDVLQSI